MCKSKRSSMRKKWYNSTPGFDSHELFVNIFHSTIFFFRPKLIFTHVNIADNRTALILLQSA